MQFGKTHRHTHTHKKIFNTLSPQSHKKSGKRRDEKRLQEGGHPETQSWMDFTAENQIGTDFLIPHFHISKLQPAQPQKYVAKGGGIKRVRDVGTQSRDGQPGGQGRNCSRFRFQSTANAKPVG